MLRYKSKGEQAIDNVLEFRNQLSDFLGGEKAFCDFEINVLDKQEINNGRKQTNDFRQVV